MSSNSNVTKQTMTTPKPLSRSPLNLISHQFTSIIVRASENEEPKGTFSLQTTREVSEHETDEKRFLLVLSLTLGSANKDDDAPYSGELTIQGEFEVSPQYPSTARKNLVKVTGASMLYGACREMLANLTARSVHGMTSLPSVSFVEKTAKKAAAKVARKKEK